MPSALQLPAEILILGARLLLILAIYGFLLIVVREIHRDWNQSARSQPSEFALVVTRSESDNISVGQAFELGPRTTIGRLRGATVWLDDEHVSARHAEISRGSNGSWHLRDAGSTNGTRLNGNLVTEEELVRPGDLIDLGTVSLRLEPLKR